MHKQIKAQLHRMIRWLSLPMVFSPLLLAACVTQGKSIEPGAAPSIEIPQLIAEPESWNGKKVRVQGWAVNAFENINLYESLSDACGNGRHAIGAEWSEEHVAYGRMRQGIFEGTFYNEFGLRPDGSILVSTGHRSPGPLKEIEVIRWLSASRSVCR